MNNSLVAMNAQYMSSKEIAGLTSKNHGDVLRDIRNMTKKLAEAKLHPIDYKELFRDNGQISEILLDKELSIILVTGYSIELRGVIIKRWMELENNLIQPKTQSLLTNDEYKSEVRKLKLETAKIKYTQQQELLKIQHSNKLEAMKAKNMRLLAKNEVKVRADLVIGKIIAPISTITDLLKENKVNIKPAIFNSLLIKHGYLQSNRMFLTDKGLNYGVNHKSKDSSKYSMPRWFEHEFKILLDEIKTLSPEYFIN